MFFERNSEEYKQVITEFKCTATPTTPEVVLKTILDNQTLFSKSFIDFDSLIKSLNVVSSSINPFNNTDKSQNVDLSSIINDGNVLILSGINDPFLAKHFKAFVNIFIINPLFKKLQNKDARSNKTYTLTSSESILDSKFTELVFNYGRKFNIHGIYTEHRSIHQHDISIRKIYENSVTV